MSDFTEDMNVVGQRQDLVDKLTELLPETAVHCLKTPTLYRISWTRADLGTRVEIEDPDFVKAMEKAIAEARRLNEQADAEPGP